MTRNDLIAASAAPNRYHHNLAHIGNGLDSLRVRTPVGRRAREPERCDLVDDVVDDATRGAMQR